MEVGNVTEEFGSKVVRFSRHFLALAALLIFGLFLFPTFKAFFLEENDSSPEAPLAQSLGAPEPMVDTVAVLTKLVGLKWAEDAGFRPELGNTQT